MTYQDVSQSAADEAANVSVARPDVDSLPSGSMGPAVGNVITGNGTTSGEAGADMVAHAPAHIVAIEGAAAATPEGNGAFEVAGHYGVLTIAADGNFHYVPNAGTPSGVQDVFNYTLADAAGEHASSTLTIDIGNSSATAQAARQTALPPGVVTLPAGVQLSDVHVVGTDLVVHLPDGSQMVIPEGAVYVPQFVIGNVEVPAQNVAALLIDSEPQPAAGPPDSSGGNFASDVPPLAPGIALGDLLPPTELTFGTPQFEQPAQGIANPPSVVIITPESPAVTDAMESVSEKGLPPHDGLPAGSGEIADGNPNNNSDTSETNSGTIVFTAQGGLQGVTIDGVAVTAVGQVIQGQFGTLTITSMDLADGQIGYSYTLTTNTSGDNTADVFAVTVTDSAGQVANASLTVHIVDDVPTAHDDSAAQTAHDAPVTVNVIANDVQGADGVNLATGVHVVAGSLTGDGTLVYNNDGTFTYTQGAGDHGDVTFQYTITDGDGDTSTATVTIDLANSIPTISTSGDNSVEEAALPFGSDPSSNAETATGSININSPDGIGTLVVDGVDVTNGGTVKGADGTLTVIHNADGTYSYSYTLTTNTSGDNTHDSFSVTITDSNGDSASTSLVIGIVDDTPTAYADSGTVSEGATLAVDAAHGVLANDVSGADGFASGGGVTGVEAGSHAGAVVTSGVGTAIAGTYGTLTLNADGSYTYVSTANAVSANATDTFTYTVTDGDGDTSTTTLTINVNDVSLVANDQVQTVDEAGLPTGSNPGSSDMVSGQLAVSGATGYTAETLTGTHGTLVLNADGSYTYTLGTAVTESPSANNGSDTVNGVETFTYTAHDADGNTVTGTITINVVDDVPQPFTTAAVTLNEGSSASASLDTADGNINNNYGADGGQVEFNPSINGTDSGMTSNGVHIIYELSPDGQTLSGMAGSTVVFTISLNEASSQYTVDVTGHIDSTTTIQFDQGGYNFVGGNAGWAGFDTVANDNSSDLLLTPGAAGQTVNTSAIAGGIGSGNSVGSGEFMRVDFVTDLSGTPPNSGGYNPTNPGFTFDGHYTTNGASALFTSTTGSTVVITAFNDADTNKLVGDGTTETITGVSISYGTGTPTLVTANGTYTIDGQSYTVTFNSNGTVSVAGVVGTSGSSAVGTDISVFTATGYNSLTYAYQAGDTFKVGDFGASISSTNPVNFTVPVQIVDGDGDIAQGTPLDITVQPTTTSATTTMTTHLVSNSVTTTTMNSTLLSSSNDNLRHELSDNGAQNTVLMGVVAAAGLAAEPLAAANHVGMQAHPLLADPSADHTAVASAPLQEPVVGSTEHVAQPLVAAPTTAPETLHLQTATSTADAKHPFVEPTSHTAAPVAQEHTAAHWDHGTAAHPLVAASVHMPAAAQLKAALGATGHAGATPTHIVDAAEPGTPGEHLGHVLADALAGGGHHGSAIDSVLQNLPHHVGSVGAAQPLAENFHAGVSNGDTGHLATFTHIHSQTIEHAIAMAHGHAAAHPHG